MKIKSLILAGLIFVGCKNTDSNYYLIGREYDAVYKDKENLEYFIKNGGIVISPARDQGTPNNYNSYMVVDKKELMKIGLNANNTSRYN